MLLKKVTLAALAGTVLLAAAPAFADQGRGDRQHFRGNQFQGNHFRGNHFQHRPAYGYYAPRHDVLGGLILGTVIGAAIVNHNRY